jgi:plasmid stabilization system protein ParE
MSQNYIVADLAKSDIFEIIEYIAEDNLNAADQIEFDILAVFDLIAENPHIGHTRKDITAKDILFWTFRKRYIIVYKPSMTVEFIRVLSGFRDLAPS